VQNHPGAVALDVTDRAAVNTAAQTLLAASRLDLMRYCAGYYKPLRATAFGLAEMCRHWDVNYTGSDDLPEETPPQPAW